MARENTCRGWLLWAGRLELFFGVTAVAATLPFFALPFGGIVEKYTKKEQKLKNEPMMCDCVSLENECWEFWRGVYKELQLRVIAAIAMR